MLVQINIQTHTEWQTYALVLADRENISIGHSQAFRQLETHPGYNAQHEADDRQSKRVAIVNASSSNVIFRSKHSKLDENTARCNIFIVNFNLPNKFTK